MSAVDEFVVRARKLRKEFRKFVAVDSISFEVKRGELFGFVGPDGAGKTTTMRMLCGVMRPSAGALEIAGVDIIASPEIVKPRIGYMSQQSSLYGDLTVAENLAFFADIHKVPKPDRTEREAELLEFSRLKPFIHRLAQDLSGGMKQKLALMCALIHKPEILFLDEPTTGVDPVSRRDLWRILYLLLLRGTTLVVSTPYMDEAERCSRIALMNKGRIIECDTPENLKSKLSAELLEIVCRLQKEAREVLSKLDVVESVQILGEILRVQVQPVENVQAIVEETLRKREITVESVKTIPPNLEDVFVSKISE